MTRFSIGGRNPEEIIAERLRELAIRPQKPTTTPAPTPTIHSQYSIDALVNRGTTFHSEERDSRNRLIGVAKSLEQALRGVTDTGIVASMPYLIAGKATADKDSNYLWTDWYTANSEECVGIDTNGTLVKKGSPVLVVFHGGGALRNPERILRAITEGLAEQHAARLDQEEFTDILAGKHGTIYTVKDVKERRIPDPFGTYGIYIPFSMVKRMRSGYFKKKAFLNNKLVLARAGTPEYLEAYFEKAKDNDGEVGNHHLFDKIDSSMPQGRVLFLSSSNDGLSGSNYLDRNGRFVGVAPEAPSGAKK